MRRARIILQYHATPSCATVDCETVFRYLGSFSQSFMLAVMLWPFVSFLLTLPIVAVIYHRNRRMSFMSAFTAYVAVLYALGLIAFTMYPMPDDPAAYCLTHHLGPQLDLFKFIEDAQSGLYGVLQLVMNIVLFLPLGFMLGRWAGWRFWQTAGTGLACSIFIETTQLTGIWGLYPCAYRYFDVDDMLTNTIGAMLGYAIAVLYTKLVPKRAKQLEGTNTHPGFVHRAVALMIDVAIMDIIMYAIVLLLTYIFYKCAVALDSTHYAIGALLITTDGVHWVPAILAAIMFAIFEVWIPWRHDGRTLGGTYTRMTVETKTRTGWRRALFYIARTLVLGAWFVLFNDGADRWFWYLTAALVVWWVFVRRMPWDLIPGDTSTSALVSTQTQMSASTSAHLQHDHEQRDDVAHVSADRTEVEQLVVPEPAGGRVGLAQREAHGTRDVARAAADHEDRRDGTDER